MAAVHHPRQTILAVGRNYAAHARELQNPLPTEPFFFLKAASCVVLPPAPIRIPAGALVHHEVELAVVFSRRASRIRTEADAWAAVLGYRVVIDLTARNWQDEAKKNSLPWTKAKCADTFLPMGPFVPKARCADPHNVELVLEVNREVKQRDSTALMLNTIPTLIRSATSFMTFEEGDMLLTGTPKGVGQIRAGDEVTIKGLGTETSFRVVADEE